MRTFYFRSIVKNKQAIIAIFAFAIFLISLSNLLITSYNSNYIDNEKDNTNEDSPYIPEPKKLKGMISPELVLIETQDVKPVEIATTTQVKRC